MCIAQLGWRQGCILSKNMVIQLQNNDEIIKDVSESEKEIIKGANESDLLIVVTHDCDLVHDSFENEPEIEVVLARSVTTENASRFWGKNPRKFQFELQPEQLLYEICVHDRVFIPRKLLLNDSPNSERQLEASLIKQVCLWISKRYFRAAFPDSFNNRITDKFKKKIAEKFKKKGKEITAIYIAGADEEVQGNDMYKIIIKATMQCETFENPVLLREAQSIIDLLEIEFCQCPGIDVAQSLLVSEADVSIDDLRFLKRWDYDHLSFRGDTPDEIAPYP
ncbi:hypothetical protein [Synechocystis sp. PCC 7509]|uniref:hypothetical protein n=1 Tax=Synechocystis sp. PCC 7509 TaxID=927677 RepID=UPI0002AC7D08|nr:hypothetical protein [Synechocystis sp. PCC 7509]